MVKGEVPLRSAPTLPSQSLADFEDEGQNYMGTSQEPYDQGNQYSGQHSSSQHAYQQPPALMMQSLLALTCSQVSPSRSEFDENHMCSTQTSTFSKMSRVRPDRQSGVSGHRSNIAGTECGRTMGRGLLTLVTLKLHSHHVRHT